LADDVQAVIAGGRVTGQLAIDSTQDPPTISAMATDRGSVPESIGPSGLTLTGGTMDGQAALTARGYSLWALRATASGEIQGAAHAVTFSGVDLPRAKAALRMRGPGLRAALQSALAGGTTGPLEATFVGHVSDGSIAITSGRLVGDAGAIGVLGTVDVSQALIDIAFSVLPAVPAPPVLGMHVTGAWASPNRHMDVTPGLAWAGQLRKAPAHVGGRPRKG
jgi:hypothetical protein